MPLDINARLQLAKSDPDAIAWIFGTEAQIEDSYLHQRLNSDYRKYEEMLLDPQVRGKLSERVGALLGRSVLVNSASTNSKADANAADTARRILDGGLVPYEQICSSFLMSGLLIGFAVQAVVKVEERSLLVPVLNDAGDLVRTTQQKILLPVLEFVPQRRFVFRRHDPDAIRIYTVNDEELDPNTDLALVHGYELRLLTKRSPYEGERCNKNQFFTFTFGSLKGLPTGYGLGAMIRRFYEIRSEVLKSGVLTGDRLGSPPVHGTYPDTLDSRDPEHALIISAFTRLLQAISPNAYAATTDGFKITFPESRSGGHTILKWLYDTAGMEITRAIWGEGSYAEKETGSYAAEAAQAANRNENVVDSDCNSLDEQMAAGFWRWIAEHNYPKANAPTIRRETFAERRRDAAELAREELRGKRVTTDRVLLSDIGLSVTPEYIQQAYGEAFSLPEATPDPGFAEFANVHQRIHWDDLTIGVLHLPGVTRFPQFRSARKLPCAYGYVEGVKAASGKSQRAYIHPDVLSGDAAAGDIYVITQLAPATGEIDELKWAIGYPSMDAAAAHYRAVMPDAFFGGIEVLSPPPNFAKTCAPGDRVTWKWSGSTATGTVKKVYRRAITLTLGKSKITRNGTSDNPALLIEQSNGAQALKLQSEVTPASSSDYAEAEAGDLEDAYAARLTDRLAESYRRALSPISQLIEQIANDADNDADRYRSFVDGIADLYDQMEQAEMAEVLGEGFAAAYLAGMYEERIE